MVGERPKLFGEARGFDPITSTLIFGEYDAVLVDEEKLQEGEVIAVGSGRIEDGKRIPLDVKPGDRVLIGKYTGTDITIDDQEYLILREEEILAKVAGMTKAASGKK
jgi:co-chaperonin GroES (HSP10)